MSSWHLSAPTLFWLSSGPADATGLLSIIGPTFYPMISDESGCEKGPMKSKTEQLHANTGFVSLSCRQMIGAWPKVDVDGVLLMFSVCFLNGIPIQAENQLHHTSPVFWDLRVSIETLQGRWRHSVASLGTQWLGEAGITMTGGKTHNGESREDTVKDVSERMYLQNRFFWPICLISIDIRYHISSWKWLIGL